MLQNTSGLRRRRLLEAERQRLPVWAVRSALLEQVRANRALILVGETGSGKTTQIPRWAGPKCASAARGSPRQGIKPRAPSGRPCCSDRGLCRPQHAQSNVNNGVRLFVASSEPWNSIKIEQQRAIAIGSSGSQTERPLLIRAWLQRR